MLRQRLVVDSDLLDEAENILARRGTTLENYLQLQLRALVSADKRYRPLTLRDYMPYGKFKGENIENIIRAEPTYIAWLVGESETFSLDSEARTVLQEILETMQ